MNACSTVLQQVPCHNLSHSFVSVSGFQFVSWQTQLFLTLQAQCFPQSLPMLSFKTKGVLGNSEEQTERVENRQNTNENEDREDRRSAGETLWVLPGHPVTFFFFFSPVCAFFCPPLFAKVMFAQLVCSWLGGGGIWVDTCPVLMVPLSHTANF